MSAVPRKADAHVSGLERARGRDSASARERSARADGLEVARSSALRAIATPEGLAEWCTLAAANVDLSAKVLLELHGQGARGPCRTRAWVLRNGARIRKGERGLAASMFGGWVWPLDRTTGRFGGVGLVAAGLVSADELTGWTGICAGDPVAGAVIAAMRGYRLESVAAVVDVASLDRSLSIVRAVAWNMPACLSCDGAGCVACSCHDDKCRQAVYTGPMTAPETPATPAPAESVARPRGRPRAVRPSIPALEEASRARSEAESVLAECRRVERAAMLESVKAGYSLGDVAAAAGVTRARIWQIVGSDAAGS